MSLESGELTEICQIPDEDLKHLLYLGSQAIAYATQFNAANNVPKLDYSGESNLLDKYQSEVGSGQFHQVGKSDLYVIVAWARMYTVQQRMALLLHPPAAPTKIIMDPIADKWGPPVGLPLENNH